MDGGREHEVPMTGDNVEPGYGLVMPFVVCRSQGGPSDDDAFVAGFRCGTVDGLLNLTASACEPGEKLDGAVIMARHAELPQLDLIAMRRGFRMAVADTGDDEWVELTFTRAYG